MVADALIYHPSVAHYLRFVAATGEFCSSDAVSYWYGRRGRGGGGGGGGGGGAWFCEVQVLMRT